MDRIYGAIKDTFFLLPAAVSWLINLFPAGCSAKYGCAITHPRAASFSLSQAKGMDIFMRKSSVHRLEKLLFALLTAALLNVVLLVISLLHQTDETTPDSPEGILNAQGSSGGNSGGQGMLSSDPSDLQASQNGVCPDFKDSEKDEDSQSALQEFLPSSITNLPEDTVTLCLTGDLMCLAGQQYTAERSDGSHDYSGSFKMIQEILKDCDFALGNLETTLSESNPYSTKERLVNEQPNCNAPADYLASLKQAGFTHLVTANNHSLDGGITGITETIAHLDEYGLFHTGTYRMDDKSERYLMLEQNGIHIALLSFTELINQRDTVTKKQLSQIIDCYGRQTAADRIAKARADGADFVIVYNHWGSENTHDIRDYQKQHAKELANAGADLIIGSHPHCLQSFEIISASDGREVPCFYSLGNVVSSMTRDINHDTVLLIINLSRNIANQESEPSVSKNIAKDTADNLNHTEQTSDNALVSIYGITLIPCHVLQTLEGSHRVITPITYETKDKKAAAELAAAKERIMQIFPQNHLIYK